MLRLIFKMYLNLRLFNNNVYLIINMVANGNNKLLNVPIVWTVVYLQYLVNVNACE